MRFTPETLGAFFKLFHKDIQDTEIELLLTGKGKWEPSEETHTQIQIIKKYQWIFHYIPGLVAVFFCNTTGFRAAKKGSDIDLFIVSDQHTLWICRVIVTFLSHIMGIRRHGDKVANRLCLSFFATQEGSFTLRELAIKGNDPYLAVWTATLECVSVRPGFLKKFHQENSWIREYGLYFTQEATPQKIHSWQEYLGDVFALIGLEWMIKKIFLPRTLKKQSELADDSGIIVSEKYLKFHNKDRRALIASKIF